MNAAQFTEIYGAMAVKSGQRYGINPAVILAIASIETNWATSFSSRNDRNFFGIKVSVNPANFGRHWDGKSKRQVGSTYPGDTGFYRVYQTVEKSFLDFGWFITNVQPYKRLGLASQSNNFAQFAKAFTTSGYMQATYEKALLSRSNAFDTELKKKATRTQ
ncbi:glucosaminidase domain-containing protein [Tellurirhabdus rosea]|uniref:glucosaminidase domain-containing protein n=1 Tax=Tellurirhabdus rosea TaxID=2674997 RepID=UPI00225BAA59|nr:glucosaminidase domain-containing protein [Tellurirhabdus rosea]